MIIKAFSEYLKDFSPEIPPVILLSRWLKDKLQKQPEGNVDRVIHHEIAYLKNNREVFALIGNSDSGMVLLESLYNFALSYEHQNFSRWVHNLKPDDFKKDA